MDPSILVAAFFFGQVCRQLSDGKQQIWGQVASLNEMDKVGSLKLLVDNCWQRWDNIHHKSHPFTSTSKVESSRAFPAWAPSTREGFFGFHWAVFFSKVL